MEKLTQVQFFDIERRYNKATMNMSFAHMMNQTKEFAEIISYGDEIVPFVLKAIKHSHTAGMNWVLVLQTITGKDIWKGTTPYIQGWRRYDVNRTIKAWVKWGELEGLID